MLFRFWSFCQWKCTSCYFAVDTTTCDKTKLQNEFTVYILALFVAIITKFLLNFSSNKYQYWCMSYYISPDTTITQNQCEFSGMPNSTVFQAFNQFCTRINEASNLITFKHKTMSYWQVYCVRGELVIECYKTRYVQVKQINTNAKFCE